jgi:hypothetical protein
MTKLITIKRCGAMLSRRDLRYSFISDYCMKEGVSLTGSFFLKVYIAQVEGDPSLCASRNVHSRTASEIKKLDEGWEKTPTHFNVVDLTTYVSSGNIDHVDMEEVEPAENTTAQKKETEENEVLSSNE